MSNAFMGQRQQASPMGFGGFGGYQQPQPYSPFSGGYGGGMGGFGTTFGGYGMGGGGYDMGYGGSPLLPPPQPTVNDLFSQYFSQQYYGGPAFNPFAATSFFGGGFGGGFGFGGGMGRGGRRRMRPQPMPVQDDMAYAGGSPGFYQNQGFTDMRARLPDRLMQPATIGAPPPSLSQLFASEFSPMQYSGPQEQLMVQPAVMQPAVMPQPPPQFTPQPYMGGFSLPFDSALPAKVEAPVAPVVQGVETIMPVPVQDTPVQAPPAYVEPAPYIPPMIEPVYAPAAPSFFDDAFLTRGNRGMYR